MDWLGEIVREGQWLYAGTVKTRVRIRRSQVWYGTGDYEDPPEEADDRDVECYYIEWEAAGGGSWGGGGAFETLVEAEEHVATASGNTIVWAEAPDHH